MQEWKYSFNSHIDWIRKNIKLNDINIFLKINEEVVGYNLLRIRKFYTRENFTNKNYYYFDTMIIDKNFRKKKLSKKIMMKSIKIIKKNNFAFLLCKKSLIRYYKKFGWILMDKKKIKILNKKTKLNYMIMPGKIKKTDFNKKQFLLKIS